MRENLKQVKQITWRILDKILNLFLSQKQYTKSLNLQQSWKSVYAVHLTQRTRGRMICCASLHYILMRNKVCITCQSLAHTVQAQRAKWWKALHLLCKCYTLCDNLKTMLEQINAPKCSVVLRNMYRRTPNIDWRQIHTQITFPCSVSLVDASIHPQLTENNPKIIFSPEISVKLGSVYPIFLQQLKNLANFHETDTTVLFLLPFPCTKFTYTRVKWRIESHYFTCHDQDACSSPLIQSIILKYRLEVSYSILSTLAYHRHNFT